MTTLGFVVVSVLLLWLAWRYARSFIVADNLPYSARATLNSPAEQAFFSAVTKAMGRRYYLACKVRIADVLEVSFKRRHPRDQRWWQCFRQISSKHVDLVICEANGGRILVAIELDDRSHQAADRVRRDRFVERAFASAGIPLIRFPAQGRYDIEALRARLNDHLGQEGAPVCLNR